MLVKQSLTIQYFIASVLIYIYGGAYMLLIEAINALGG